VESAPDEGALSFSHRYNGDMRTSALAVSTPDARKRVVRRVRGMGLWSILVVFCIPHVWIGAGMLVAVVVNVFSAVAGLVGVHTPFFPNAGVMLVPFMLCWNAFVATFVWGLAIAPLRSWLLLRRGVRTEAVVDDVTIVNGRRGRWHSVAFHWFAHGERFDTRRNVSASSVSLVTGQRLDAYYDAKKPQRAVIPMMTSWEVTDE
jgi:hypothetical protein